MKTMSRVADDETVFELEFWVGGVAGLRSSTPEPGVLLLWGTTALGLGVVARRRRRQRSAVSA
jgi:MYXO-CTERM domain-containing protein